MGQNKIIFGLTSLNSLRLCVLDELFFAEWPLRAFLTVMLEQQKH